MKNKIFFVINGKIKKIDKLENEIKYFFFKDFDIEILRTKKKSDGILYAQKATNNSADFLIAIGGDGTINEVVNGVMLANAQNRKNIAVGLLPTGTGNDFARSIKMKKSIKYLHFLIKNNLSSKIDIGKINFTNFDNSIETRFFINIADMGVGAETVRIVNGSSKFLGSTLTFLLTVLRVFANYKHQNLRFFFNDEEHQNKIVTLCFAKGKYFGSGLGVAPHACTTDGFLSMTIVGELNILHFLKYMPAIRKCKLIKNEKISYQKTKFCKVESNDSKKYPVEIDGEYIGTTPFKIEVVPNIINFLMEK